MTRSHSRLRIHDTSTPKISESYSICSVHSVIKKFPGEIFLLRGDAIAGVSIWLYEV